MNSEEIDELKIASINVTALGPKIGTLATMDAHIVCIQEHSTGPALMEKHKAKLRKMGWSLVPSPAGPGIKNTGVACMAREPITVVPWTNGSDTYQVLHELGRCAIYTIEIKGKALELGVMYGATGGHEYEECRAVTFS